MRVCVCVCVCVSSQCISPRSASLCRAAPLFAVFLRRQGSLTNAVTDHCLSS